MFSDEALVLMGGTKRPGKKPRGMCTKIMELLEDTFLICKGDEDKKEMFLEEYCGTERTR